MMTVPKISQKSLKDDQENAKSVRNNFYMTEIINVHFDVVITDDTKGKKIYCIVASMRGINNMTQAIYTNTFYTSIRVYTYEELHVKLNKFLGSSFMNGAAVIRDYDIYDLDPIEGPLKISSGIWPIFNDYESSLQLTKEKFNSLIMNG